MSHRRAVPDCPKVPIVDGTCPFDKASLPPECTATAATHFALAAGPASDTAVLLPLAQRERHVWRHPDVARTSFEFLALPETPRPGVFNAVVAILQAKARDAQSCSGYPQYPGDMYDAIIESNIMAPECSGGHTSSCDGATGCSMATTKRPRCEPTAQSGAEEKGDSVATCTPATVATLCQLCRIGHLLSCSTMVDAACYRLGLFIRSISANQAVWPFVALALRVECAKDLQGTTKEDLVTANSAEVTVSEGDIDNVPDDFELDEDHIRAVVAADVPMILGARALHVPDILISVLPPFALPRSVLRCRLPCFLSSESSCWQPIYAGACTGTPREETAYIFVTTSLGVADGAFNTPFKSNTLEFLDTSELERFFVKLVRGVVLPRGTFQKRSPIDLEALFKSRLLSAAKSITFPSDFDDSALAEVMSKGHLRHLTAAETIDLSRTSVTRIPSKMFADPGLDVVTVGLPATLESVEAFGFAGLKSLAELRGLKRSEPKVTVDPMAFVGGSPSFTVTTEGLVLCVRGGVV